MSNSTPWASGPGEILRHGLHLLRKDNDVNRRLAMISIDNAVELMIKTYLGLPKRVSGLAISRKDLQEISESFPAMLDALEQHAASKLTGIDLGEIEWYHRLRNQLYHQGNGLTVERDKVTIYAELANTLFANLFGTRLVEEKESPSDILGTFLHAWRTLEANLTSLNIKLGMNRRPGGVLQTLRLLADKNVLDRTAIEEIQSLARIRNEVVHAQPGSQDLLNPEVVSRIQLQANNLAALEKHTSGAGAPAPP